MRRQNSYVSWIKSNTSNFRTRLGPPSPRSATVQHSELWNNEKEVFGSRRRTFCCNKTTLGLIPREPPWRQLRSWTSPSYSCASAWARLLRRQLMTYTITSFPKRYWIPCSKNFCYSCASGKKKELFFIPQNSRPHSRQLSGCHNGKETQRVKFTRN
jgi:hypothetical protein